MFKLSLSHTTFDSTISVFNTIISPLINTFTEITWFADEKVIATTEHARAGTHSDSWASYLIKAGKIPGPYIGQRYIELERTLSSIVAMMALLDGGLSAYKYFTIMQPANDKLSTADFNKLHVLAKNIIKNQNDLELIIGALIYSDLGKTIAAHHRASEFIDITKFPDHDDFLGALFNLPIDALGKLIPSFNNYSEMQRKILISIFIGMKKIHLGHVSQMEGGTNMLIKFIQAVKEGLINDTNRNILKLVHFCDVAAARAHGDIRNNALTASCYLCYDSTFEILEHIQPDVSNSLTELELANQIIYRLIEKFQTILCINTGDPLLNQLATRLSMMMRVVSAEAGVKVVAAIVNLKQNKPHCYELLCEQFNINSGFNRWLRNPTYIPTGMSNILQNQLENIPIAIDYASFIAMQLRIYSTNDEVTKIDKPISFRILASFAAEHPRLFDPSSFQADLLALNEQWELVPSVRLLAKLQEQERKLMVPQFNVNNHQQQFSELPHDSLEKNDPSSSMEYPKLAGI